MKKAETVKSFPSEWQSKAMSKKWHDVYWPLIHTSFAILIIGLLVNGLFPIVDGTGGMVELEIRSDQPDLNEWQLDDGTIVTEGQATPCDPAVQEGKCKNSLTPLAGKASSMPGKFYWDTILFMALAGVGLIWSLYTHLILAPGWRARVKAMKDIDEDREEIKETIEEESASHDDNLEEEVSEEEDTEDGEPIDEDGEDEFDIGSYVGLEIDGEDYYGQLSNSTMKKEQLSLKKMKQVMRLLVIKMRCLFQRNEIEQRPTVWTSFCRSVPLLRYS